MTEKQKELPPAGQGDERTPEKKIGEVKYSERESPGWAGQDAAKGKQGIVSDERGQQQPADKARAQQSANEGPAAYAPNQGETAKGGRQ